MTTAAPLSLWETLRRRLNNTYRTLFARGDGFALLVACMLMVVPVLAFSGSININDPGLNGWRVNLGQLIPVAILSVIFGFLLSRSHYSETTALLLSIIYGIGVILAIQLLTAPGDPIERVRLLVFRFSTSLQTTLAGDFGLDPFLLMMFLSILIWFLGHNTAWHTFRLDRIWRAVLPPGIVLVLNSFYSNIQNTTDSYLIIYLFLALLMIIRSHVEAREFDWYANRVAFRGNLREWFFRAGALICAAVIGLAWLLPTGNADDNNKRFQEFINNGGITRVMELLNKLFTPLETSGTATADYYGGETLRLGSPIQLGDNPVMSVAAPAGPRYYWKSRIFDTYAVASGGLGSWTGNRASRQVIDTVGTVLNYADLTGAGRLDVEQRFTMLVTTRLLYAAPQIAVLRTPVEMEYDPISGGYVDPAIFRTVKPLAKSERYTVKSSISKATAPELRGAGTAYPDWVVRYNLQLPPELSGRVRDLAAQLTAGLPTPYDKAKALERYLRETIVYEETPKAIPAGRELVDFVLFESREGYCTYYATAMVMMLRSQGIPARMAAGFAAGLYDQNQASYLVRDRDAHTWVEVYFPGYGWVEFEPTAAQLPLERPDQSITPTPSPTPSPTPTSIPPTATSNAFPPNQPSATPPPGTVSPTPATATPNSITPTPTQTPPPAPPPPNFLELPPAAQNFLGWLLGIALVVTLLSVGAVSFLWWVEYRGLDEFSPISRAYARLAIYARWLRIPLSDSQTPLERGRKVAREVPTGGRDLMRITDNYIVERYAPPRPRSEEEKQSETSWRRSRRELVMKKLRQWAPRWWRRKS